MGYFSCNAESAIATCDPYNWDYYRKNITTPRKAKEKKNKTKLPISTPNPTTSTSTQPIVRHFTYSHLLKATNSFSPDSFLGKGSHGSVYKATLDGGSLTAAVKLTNSDNELEILSRVPHNPHLVNLLGFCSRPEPTHKLLLVVEYMPSGSLHDHLHNSTNPPGWTGRTRFALQVARAVHFLHSLNPPVIHRDIKSSNVLIDKDNNARLGDFGLALRGHVEDVRVKSTPPAGTLGYLDPGYLAPGDLSAKSDVFSFGILLLEIISGRKAIDVDFSPPSVVDWAVPLIKKREFGSVWDPRVGNPGDWFRELAGLAVRCVRSNAERRPGMGEVVEVLRGVIKRVRHAPCVWKRLRRKGFRLERVESTRDDASEDVLVVRVGSRRNSSKVSSVPGVECSGRGSEMETVRLGVGRARSRSIGSFGEVSNMKRLSKSRSMGVLSWGHVGEYERGVRSREAGGGLERELSFVGLGDKYEKKMEEKPLVLV